MVLVFLMGKFTVNSLQQLNQFANTSITFNDQRLPLVSFSLRDPENQSVSTIQNQSFTSPVATDIIKVVKIPEPIVFTINTYPESNVGVVWSNISGNLVANTVGYNNRVYGIATVADWDKIKRPTIYANTANNFNYTNTITYIGGNTKTWTTVVAVNPITELSFVNDFYYLDGNNLVTGTPVVQPIGTNMPAYATDNYTLTIVPSDPTLLGTGNITTSGIGTSTSNATTKTVTITGNSTKLNTHLANVRFVANVGLDSTWEASYNLYNPVTNYTTTRVQTLRSEQANVMTRSNVQYYVNSFNGNVSGYPTITNNLDNPASNHIYKMQIYPNPYTALANLTIGANIGALGNVTKTANTITMIGTKNQINTNLTNFRIQTKPNYIETFQLYYVATVPGDPNKFANVPTGNIGTRIQTFYNDTSGLINNMSQTRNFDLNTPTLIFSANTPAILDSGPGTYAIYLSSTAGEFGTSDTNTKTTYALGSSRTGVNGLFSTIKFYPYKDVTGNQTFNFSLRRVVTGSVDEYLIRNQPVALIGSNIDSNPQDYTRTFTSSGTYTPTYQERNYYYMDVLAVGAGGGGGYVTRYPGGTNNPFVINWSNEFIDASQPEVNRAALTAAWNNLHRKVIQGLYYDSHTINSYGETSGQPGVVVKNFYEAGGWYWNGQPYYPNRFELPANIGGGGGGGGNIRVLNNINLKTTTNWTNTTLNITVGTPGQPVSANRGLPNVTESALALHAPIGYNGGAGGSTTIGNLTATGGAGGTHNWFGNASGGASNGGTINSGKKGGNGTLGASTGDSGGPGYSVSWAGNVAFGAGGGAAIPDANQTANIGITRDTYIKFYGNTGGNVAFGSLNAGGQARTLIGASSGFEEPISSLAPGPGCGGAGGHIDAGQSGGSGIVILRFHKT